MGRMKLKNLVRKLHVDTTLFYQTVSEILPSHYYSKLNFKNQLFYILFYRMVNTTGTVNFDIYTADISILR